MAVTLITRVRWAAPDECDRVSGVAKADTAFQAHPLVKPTMHLAKPCCEPVMETGSPQQDARRTPLEENGRVAVGVFSLTD